MSEGPEGGASAERRRRHVSRREFCGAIAALVALRLVSCEASGPSVDVDDHRTQTTQDGGELDGGRTGPSQ